MTNKILKDENDNMPASIILADAMGRYSAYNYCMRQIDSMSYQVASELSRELRQLRAQIEERWMDAADDRRRFRDRSGREIR